MDKKFLNQEPDQQNVLDKDLDKLLYALATLHKIQDSVHREYEFLRMAKQLDIPIDSFRQMLKDYARKDMEAASPDWQKPFWFIEHKIESLNRLFSEWDLLPVIDQLSKLSLIVVVILFFIGLLQQAEQKEIEKKKANYEAWKIVTDNRGRIESGGRIDALQDLHKSKVSLLGIDVKGANLSGIKLEYANLIAAKLDAAVLVSSNFSNSNLTNASLRGANLTSTNLRQTNLIGTDMSGSILQNSDLYRANLNGSLLRGSNLIGTDLSKVIGLDNAELASSVYDQTTIFPEGFDPSTTRMYLIKPGANLKGSDLSGANLLYLDLQNINLSNADLRKAILRYTNMKGVNLSGANLEGADLIGARNLNVMQVKSANNWQKARYSDDLLKQLGLNLREVPVPAAG
jgi:uncharacterized protein YjbI with pentapeptide repeats